VFAAPGARIDQMESSPVADHQKALRCGGPPRERALTITRGNDITRLVVTIHSHSAHGGPHGGQVGAGRAESGCPAAAGAGPQAAAVAQLAGMSVTWYTWLERGRPIRASVGAGEAAARTLRLDPSHASTCSGPAEVPGAAGPAGDG